MPLAYLMTHRVSNYRIFSQTVFVSWYRTSTEGISVSLLQQIMHSDPLTPKASRKEGIP